jgi:hypothetical protein
MDLLPLPMRLAGPSALYGFQFRRHERQPYHNVAGNTAGGSQDNANELRPYSATVLSCIKF